VPYDSVASAQVIRGKGTGIDRSSVEKNLSTSIRSQAAKTSSTTTKAIATSIWVNAG